MKDYYITYTEMPNAIHNTWLRKVKKEGKTKKRDDITFC